MDSNLNQTYLMNLTVISKLEAGTSDFKQFFCREEGIALWEKVQKLTNTSAFIHRKKELVDKLRSAGCACMLDDDMDTLWQKVLTLPDGAAADRALFLTLKSAFDSFATPTTVISNLVKNLGDSDFKNDPTRLAILKQFIKYTNYHTAPVLALLASRTGRNPAEYKANIDIALSELDESIFDVLNGKLTKDDKKRYHLLRMIDDLANGRYKTNGSTKTALYMFAFAYDMDVFVDPFNEIWDPERDVEKKLLYEYYSNSFLRFLTEDYKKRRSDYEAEPLGDGINYKNYVEVIYIYCLSRKDMARGDKLKLAETLIEECEKKAHMPKRVDLSSQDGEYTLRSRFTYIYKDLVTSTLMKLPVSEVADYICSYYEINGTEISGSKITVNMDTRTANYHISGKNIVKHFTDEDIQAEISSLKLLFPGEDEFVDLMGKMYTVLYSPVLSRKNGIVQRSDLLTRFFYKALSDDSLQGRSIYDLYVYMCATLRPVLIESRFQTISSNNIFDMFVLVTLYRQLNVI